MNDRQEPANVTICSSSRFYKTVAAVASQLRERGFVVFTPRLDMNETEVNEDRTRKHALTTDFLSKVSVSESIYIVNPGGYVGLSVAIETGFAYARGISIFAMELPSEPAIEALISGVRAPSELR